MIEPFENMMARLDDCDVMNELLGMEEDEAQIAQGWKDLEAGLALVEKHFNEMELKSLLGGKLDANNCYLSINAGAGGTESCDWASILNRMYMRFCEDQGWKYSVLDIQDGEEAGIKSINIHIEGSYAYGMLKSERGVHRLVRISPFDSNARRHTSFTAVDVVAEIDETVDVQILDADVRVDTYRASGSGGQHVNKTDSAVRLTHAPSGIVVACQSERSQHSNRDKAYKLLAAKLYEWEMDKKRKEIEKFYDPKGSIAWGSQIRSYVLQPYTMVTDLRTELKIGNSGGVLEGDLLPLIESYLKWKRRENA
jgi:peptide chain release factor 2